MVSIFYDITTKKSPMSSKINFEININKFDFHVIWDRLSTEFSPSKIATHEM